MSNENGQLLLYQENGIPRIQVTLRDGSVWLSQAQMAELFQTDQSGIARHIKNIFSSGELDENSIMQKMHIANSDKPVQFYNLDMIISVGYRVNSHIGTRFRIWATQRLSEYVVKGFTMDDKRLSGEQPNYFDELIERVRRIRASEKNFYAKVTDIFATSIDYTSGSDLAKNFFATVQNKFHFAITHHTASELIAERVSASKQNMGLTNFSGQHITKDQAVVAKNYLEELELKRLELLVEQFLAFAELRSIEKTPMYMKDWQQKLDDFLRLNDKEILQGAGKVSQKAMKGIVSKELEAFNKKALPASRPPKPKSVKAKQTQNQ